MLTGPRNTKRREGDERGLPVKAGAVIHQGGIVVMNGAFADKGQEAAGIVAVGMAQAPADNSGGADGAIRVPVRSGCFAFANSATDAVDRTDIGKTVYIEDDETVSATDNSGARSAAGICFDVDEYGVWVKLG